MGQLDKKSRIMDFKLTSVGKELLSRGRLEFTYYRFFDDGINYEQAEDVLVKIAMPGETIANSEYDCKRALGTIEPDGAHVKPYMKISKNSVTMRKQQQEGSALSELSLVGVIDVFVEEEVEQFETTPPVYATALDLGIEAYVPVIGNLTTDEENTEVMGEDFPGEAEEKEGQILVAPLKYHAVHGLSDAEEIELNLVGAPSKRGFKVEVFYSGTSAVTSGSEDNLIKLTERGLDELSQRYGATDEDTPPDIKGGYGDWFTIRTK